MPEVVAYSPIKTRSPLFLIPLKHERLVRKSRLGYKYGAFLRAPLKKRFSLPLDGVVPSPSSNIFLE